MSQDGTSSDFTVQRVASLFIILALIIFCLSYFSSFLQPIVIAVMIWYGVYELKRMLGKIKIKGWSIPSWMLSILAFLLISLITAGIYELIVLNLELIIESFPKYTENFKSMIANLQAIKGFEVFQERMLAAVSEIDIRSILSSMLNSLTNLAGNIFIIIIYVAFIMVEEKFFQKKLHSLASTEEKKKNLDKLIHQIETSVRKYISVKTQMSLLTGILSYGILVLFDVDFPVLWGFLIFLLNYIPYLGSFVATLLPAAFAVFQFQSFLMFVWIFIAVQIVQLVIGNILEPKVMGRTLNLSPLGVLLALTFWGIIWGVLGMFLAVPITSVTVITLSRFPSTRIIAVWLSETGELGNI